MFPAALPAIFAGLRISAGLSVIGAIVGDFFFGKGKAGTRAAAEASTPTSSKANSCSAAVIITSLLGVVVFLDFGFIQQRVIGKWYESTGAK